MNKYSITVLVMAVLSSANPATAEGDADNGKALARTNCARCHGIDGNARSTSFRPVPMLAGQPAKYLVNEMQNYASGARKDPTGDVMTGFLQDLSKQDFEDIAAFYAAQTRY